MNRKVETYIVQMNFEDGTKATHTLDVLPSHALMCWLLGTNDQWLHFATFEADNLRGRGYHTHEQIIEFIHEIYDGFEVKLLFPSA